MNFPAQGLQSTWPHGIASIALIVFDSTLLQAGQMRVETSSEGSFDSAVVNFTETRDLRENGWEFVDEEGHDGESLDALTVEALPLTLEEGVREGTQKEGRVCLEA